MVGMHRNEVTPGTLYRWERPVRGNLAEPNVANDSLPAHVRIHL